jgi:hypothetical protein
MFWEAGYKGSQLQYLNRCRLVLRLLFLLAIAIACGHFLDVTLFSAPHFSQDHGLSFTFLNEKPSLSGWKLCLNFWSASVRPGSLHHQLLGEWMHLTHWKWIWFYRPHEDLLYQSHNRTTEVHV